MSNGIVLLQPSQISWSVGPGGVLYPVISWVAPSGGLQLLLENSTDNTNWNQQGTWNPSAAGAVYSFNADSGILTTAWRMRYLTRS